MLEQDRQRIVSSILSSIPAGPMASGAALLLFHPFALATAVIGAGAITGTVLLRMLWGQEETQARIIRAMASRFYSPSQAARAAAPVSAVLLQLAARMDELPDGLHSQLQLSEFDENIDVSILDNGQLQQVVKDVTSFLQDAGSLPSASGEPLKVELEPAVVSRLVTDVIDRCIRDTDVPGRHRGEAVELLLAMDAAAVIRLRFDYKWDTKRSCMWKKIDLHMLREILWFPSQQALRQACAALVWAAAPAAAGQPAVEQKETWEGEGEEAAAAEGQQAAAAGEQGEVEGQVEGEAEGEGEQETGGEAEQQQVKQLSADVDKLQLADAAMLAPAPAAAAVAVSLP